MTLKLFNGFRKHTLVSENSIIARLGSPRTKIRSHAIRYLAVRLAQLVDEFHTVCRLIKLLDGSCEASITFREASILVAGSFPASINPISASTEAWSQ